MKKITLKTTEERIDSCNMCHISNYRDGANINALSFTSENNQTNVVKVCDDCLVMLKEALDNKS